MHKVTLPDGTRVQDHWLKWMRVLAYLLMCLTGVLALLSPVLTVNAVLLAQVMSGFLVLGGFLSMLGALFERWWGEYTGIPLLASAFAVFALISTWDSFGTLPYLALANMFLLIAVALGLMSRWRDARAVYHLAAHFAKHPPEKGVDDDG